ncbi:MAG: hypothetical protein JWR26_3085 [Pedosphaera sp.]|nr:hypothetical protein [Pedosphaera sp.]
MTTRELIHVADREPWVLAGVFVAAPVAAWLCGQVHKPGEGGKGPYKYVYSGLVYLTCLPGMFAGVLTAYTMFFSKENLLDVSLLVYILPIVSMIVTLVLIRKNVSFDEVPGFDRLSGLMVMIGCSFAIALAIEKTRIFIFFGGSIERLFALAIGIFALIKWGMYMLFRGRNEPRKDAPKLTGL